jgi:hypothetical protein
LRSLAAIAAAHTFDRTPSTSQGLNEYSRLVNGGIDMTVASKLKVCVFSSIAVVIGGCSDSAVQPRYDERKGGEVGWLLRDGQPWRFGYVVVGDRAVIEGDIDLGSVSGIARTREELLSRASHGGDARFNVVKDASSRWPLGTVPYEFQDFSRQSDVVSALAELSQLAGGLQFRPKLSFDSHWIRFVAETDSEACGSSPVGRQSAGPMEVKLRLDCATFRATTQHEVLHALGFWHTHSRCDRDQFVQIVYGNIPWQRHNNFEKYCVGGAIDIGPYDEASIMHYPSNAFAIFPALPTIISLTGALVGSQGAMRPSDIYSVQTAYRPYATIVTSMSNSGGFPQFSWQALVPTPVVYSVNLRRIHVYTDDVNGTQTESDLGTEPVGSTGGTTITDLGRPFTGSTVCQITQGLQSSTAVHFYYEITATYGNGIGGQSRRWPAPVAPSTCG